MFCRTLKARSFWYKNQGFINAKNGISRWSKEENWIVFKYMHPTHIIIGVPREQLPPQPCRAGSTGQQTSTADTTRYSAPSAPRYTQKLAIFDLQIPFFQTGPFQCDFFFFLINFTPNKSFSSNPQNCSTSNLHQFSVSGQTATLLWRWHHKNAERGPTLGSKDIKLGTEPQPKLYKTLFCAVSDCPCSYQQFSIKSRRGRGCHFSFFFFFLFPLFI